MAEGRMEEEWNHTSLIACILSNMLKTKKDKASKIDDFHPYRRMNSERKMRLTTKELQSLFGCN